MRYFSYALRFLVMTAVLWWYSLVYATGRVRTLFIRDREARSSAIAHLRGQVLRRAMSRLGACFLKLRQVLSTRPDLLDQEIIDELRKLQDRLPPFPFERVREVLERDLGGTIEERFAEFDRTPVAAASVAQVHRARLKDGTEVAVKVLRPDVRDKVNRDATILLALARIIELHPTWRLSQPYDHLLHFVDGIREQTNLDNEIAHYALFRRNFAAVQGVRFPAVFAPLSSQRVMTMEFLRGHKLDALPPGDHRELALRVQNVIFKMCYEDGFVHADMHPGNLLLHESGDLAIFDVGLCKQLAGDVFDQFVDFARCIAMGTPSDFLVHMKRFHTYATDVDWTALEAEITAFIGQFRRRNVAELELGTMVHELLSLARRHRVRPMPDITLVLVGLVTAEGIGKQLHPDRNLFQQTAEYLVALQMRRAAEAAARARAAS